jgi:glycosyltransferase involved in cell wall biosynthesis
VRPGIRRIGVVVPAHNEEDLIVGCILALRVATKAVSIPARVLVVLDDCTDRTETLCTRLGVETCRVAARNVGAARAAGTQMLLAGEAVPESIWVATTDADTRVEPAWLRHQVELADTGADVVLGVVHLGDDVATHRLRQSFEADYQKRLSQDGTHEHVHGASMGLRGSVYLRAGGFPPVANHEDRRLVRQLHGMDNVSIEASQGVRVRTSGRTNARCDQGFAAHLKRIEDSAEAASGAGTYQRSKPSAIGGRVDTSPIGYP